MANLIDRKDLAAMPDKIWMQQTANGSFIPKAYFRKGDAKRGAYGTRIVEFDLTPVATMPK